MIKLLLNFQRVELHGILERAHVDPASTKWTNDTKGWTHRPVETLEIGRCYFVFCPEHDSTLNGKCSPATNGSIEQSFVDWPWDEVLGLFHRWSEYVRLESSAEDPWLRYAAFLPPEAIAKGTDNSPFTFQEASQAHAAVTALVANLKDNIADYASVEDVFDNRFEQLSKSAKEGAGRIDWSNQFMTVILTLALTLSLDPEQGAQIWRFWLNLIRGTFPTL